MRRTQSVKNYVRPSLALATDDLGVLREGDETNEDVLRRQLLDRDRENDKLQTQIQLLQAQLAQRPPIERIQELEKEYRNLDLLLQGTQRENERCMTELDRARQREKMLENALAKLAGENWQSSLDIAPPTVSTRLGHSRSNTLASASPMSIVSHAVPAPAPTYTSSPRATAQVTSAEQQLAHIEQVRLLILGMEQRLQTREEKLAKTLERAQGEGRKFEQLRKEISAGVD